MKLRVRSLSTNATVRVTAPDSSTLADLKSLIAAQLSPTITDPSSLLLSLNRRDPLLSPDPAAPLAFLGLTSGDLLFLLHPAPVEQPPQLAHGSGSPGLAGGSVSQPAANHKSVSDSAMQESPDPEAEPVKKRPPFASFLTGVMEAEQCLVTDDLGRLAGAVHAVFLQSGFVVSGMSDGFLSRLARGSPVRYTVPEAGDGVKLVTLRFSPMRRYVTVHGFVSGGDGTTHRVCLDVPKTAPALDFDAKCLFQLWKVVRDGLVLPLLIDFCEMNGLDLPPCFARLPTELKTKVLELLPGEDVARVSCVGRELRYIASDDELWRLRFIEEFGTNGSRVEGRTWKDKFMKVWLMAKERSKRTRMQETHLFGARDRLAPRIPFPLPGLIGGDYDLFPSFGGIGPLGPGPGFPHLPGTGIGFPHLPGTGTGFPHLPGTGVGLPHRPGRRNFSPQCNLDERDPSFM